MTAIFPCICRRLASLIVISLEQTQGVFNAAKRLTEKMRRKGMLTTRKEAGGASAGDGGGAAGDGDGSDYEIREDGVELTDSKVVRKKRGTWATAED